MSARELEKKWSEEGYSITLFPILARNNKITHFVIELNENNKKCVILISEEKVSHNGKTTWFSKYDTLEKAISIYGVKNIVKKILNEIY